MGVQDGQCSSLLPRVTQSLPEEDMAEPGLEKATEQPQAVKEEGHSRNRKLQEQSCGVSKRGSHLIGWRESDGLLIGWKEDEILLIGWEEREVLLIDWREGEILLIGWREHEILLIGWREGEVFVIGLEVVPSLRASGVGKLEEQRP